VKKSDFYKSLIDDMHDGVYFTDLDRRITYWNKGAERLTGYKRAEVLGRRCSDNLLEHVDQHGVNLCNGLCPLAMTLLDGKPRQAEVYLKHSRGHRIPVSVRVSPVQDPEGKTVGAVEIFNDISVKVRLEEQIRSLEKMALIDALTNLGNRRYLEITLRSKLNELKRYGLPFGVLFLDVDRFKAVNDHYGHDVGDEVLKMVAQTISNALRPFDHAGRWGGEEFLAIVSNVDMRGLEAIADRLRLLVQNSSIKAGGNTIRVTVSIGAAYAVKEDTPESIPKRADALMYQSKLAGRNRVTVEKRDGT